MYIHTSHFARLNQEHTRLGTIPPLTRIIVQQCLARPPMLFCYRVVVYSGASAWQCTVANSHITPA